MSAKLTGAVWELDLPRPEKFVALALADHGKDDGSDVYPSLARIEWKTGYSRTQVREIMQSLQQKRLLRLVRKGGTGRGDCDEYRMETCNIASLPDFKIWNGIRNKGAKTAPMPSATGVNIGDEVVKGTETAPFTQVGFPHKGTESEPITGDRMGAVPVEKGYGFGLEKGTETAPELKPNQKPRTKPSATDVADPRHQSFRELVITSHATANEMPPELVTWDGREGKSLSKFLESKPKITAEQFHRCVLNYYRSDVNISRRPSEGILKDPMAFWLGDTNEFDRPRIFTERFQHSRKAAVGANR